MLSYRCRSANNGEGEMAKSVRLLAGMIAGVVAVSGCSQSGPEPVSASGSAPLSASECEQLEKKQVELTLAEMPAEFRANVVEGSVTSDLDCAALKEHGRAFYDCMMPATSTSQIEQCMTKAYAGG
jgi:hypothetical protein